MRGIDERRGQVYFMATLKTPLERQLYVADLDGERAHAGRDHGAGRLEQRDDERDRSDSCSATAIRAAAAVSLHDISGERLAGWSRTGLTRSTLTRPISIVTSAGIRHDSGWRRHAALLQLYKRLAMSPASAIPPC